MLSFVAGVLFVLAPAQEADAAAELQAAVHELAQAESLQFELLSESTSAERDDGGGDPGGRRGGTAGASGYSTVQGVWKKGLPMRLTSGGQVAYKQGDRIVHQDEQGQWQVLEMGRGGRGGGAPEGAPGGGRRPEGSGDGPAGGERGAGGRQGFGPMGGGRALFGLASVQAPGELFAGFAVKVADVSKESKDGTVVFSGALSQAGAESLAGRGPRPRGPQGGEGDTAPEVETTGTYAITVVEGAIVSAVFEVRRVGSFGERSFDRTTKRTLKIEELGAAQLEVPEEVLTLLR